MAMDPRKLQELKLFVQMVRATPSILAEPSLLFFREYLESLSAKLPQTAYGSKQSHSHSHEHAHGPNCSHSHEPEGMEDEEDDGPPDLEDPEVEVPEEEEEEIVESDVEIEEEDVVAPDDGEPQQMGDSSKEVTEEDRDASQIAKGKAMEALGENKLEDAVGFLTEAITSNPCSALHYGNRAGIYVKLKKPNAAIRDCDAALKINPDSARAYKSRGEAKALLGQWEESAADLRLAARLDYDEETAAFLKKVEPNAKKLEEHRRKYDRLRKEKADAKAEKDRVKRKAAAQAAYDAANRASEKAKPRGFPGGMPAGMGGMGGMPGGMGGMPGGMPGGMGGMPGGMGGMPGMGGGPDMSNIFSDPEMMAAFQDPEVMAALQEVMSDPSKIGKYTSDPKLGPILTKLMSKVGGGGM